MTEDQGGTVARLDAANAKQVWRTKVCRTPGAIARVSGVLWIVCTIDNSVARVDAASGELLGRTKTGRDPVDVTIGFGSVWTANLKDKTVTRIDLRSARATATIKVTDGVVRLSAGKTAVWATGEGSTVNRIDPRTDRVVGAAVNVGDGPLGVDATSDLVWVAVENTGQVTGLDPAFRSPRGPFTVGGHPGEIAVGGGKVWVTDARGRSVDVVDLTTGAVRTLPLETTPTKVTWSGSAAWVSCVDPNELIRLS